MESVFCGKLGDAARKSANCVQCGEWCGRDIVLLPSSKWGLAQIEMRHGNNCFLKAFRVGSRRWDPDGGVRGRRGGRRGRRGLLRPSLSQYVKQDSTRLHPGADLPLPPNMAQLARIEHDDTARWLRPRLGRDGVQSRRDDCFLLPRHGQP